MDDLERFFLDNLALVERIVEAICRRNRLTKEESEDFASVAKIKLIADNYAVLRKFSGRASLRGYLTTVIQHAYQDHRNRQWGKWRPSAEARRLGPLAMKLDTLLHRDGLSLDEACALAPAEERDEMRRLATLLPPRTKRRMEDAQQLEQVPALDSSPEALLLDSERDAFADSLERELAEAVDALPPEDRALLRLRLEQRMSLVNLAKVHGCEARHMYRRWELLIRELRAHLERSGYEASRVAWVLEPRSTNGREEIHPGPSNRVG